MRSYEPNWRLIGTKRCQTMCSVVGYCICGAGKSLEDRIAAIRKEAERRVDVLINEEG